MIKKLSDLLYNLVHRLKFFHVSKEVILNSVHLNAER
jgi:hypothetical protein